MKFTKRTGLVLTTAVAMSLAIGIGLWRLRLFFEESVLNSYRLVSAGELFLGYKRKTGNWPSDWDALQQYASANRLPLYGCEDFGDLTENIDIDFSIDLSRVDTTNVWSENKPQIQIIVSKTGQTHGAAFDPNEQIYSELRKESEEMKIKP